MLTDLGELRTEIELIIKAQEQETSVKMTDPKLKIQVRPFGKLFSYI